MNLRICRISQNFRPEEDGLSRHVLSLSKEQARRGHSVWLFQPFKQSGAGQGLTLVRVNTGRLRERLGYKLYTLVFCLFALPYVWRYHRRVGFDLLHLHGDVLEAFIFGLFAKAVGLPAVLTVHGGLNRKRLYAATAPFLFRFVDLFIPISRPVRRDLERVKVAPEKIRTISTGINLPGFVEAAKLTPVEARRKLGIPLSRQMVLTTGRFHPVKGFEYLIRAAGYFPPDKGPLFYFLGDGPLWEPLREKAGSLNHVILPGKKSHQEVLLHYRAADVFVMCSVDLPWQSEAIPTVLIEALALGLPVVATDTGEGPDLIQDGVNGFVVPQRDPKKLREAIESLLGLLDSPENRARIAEHNKGLAAERDWPRVAEKIEDVYLLLLGRRG